MAFMRADCKYPFGGDPAAQAVTCAYISHDLCVFWRRWSPEIPFGRRNAPFLSRLAAQLGGELPQINRISVAVAGSVGPSVLGAGRNVRELHSHRSGDRLAECDRLTIGDRGQEGDRAAGRNARRSPDNPLVELVGEPHREQGRTLTQQ